MREELEEQLRGARRQIVGRDRQIEDLRGQLEAQRLDDGERIRRRRIVPERIEYRQALERVANFVDNELGNERAPQRPDNGEWRKQRVKSIKTLNELREKLDTICVGANYGKATGNGAEVLGATGAIIGAVLSLGGLPSGQALMNVGNLVRDAGNLLEGVSNVIESLFSANYLSDIEAVLKRDQELSRPFAEWLDFTKELDANVERIFGVSLASEKFKTVMKVFHEFAKFSTSVNSFDATMRIMRQGRYSVHIGTDVKVKKLEEFFQHLSTFPQLSGRIGVVLSVLSVSTGAVQVFGGGVRLYRCLMGTSSTSVVPSLQGGLIPTGREVSVYCVFQAISLANGLISLLNAASIIRHGKSKYSDAIKELTRSLAWELREMDNA